jgi:hypothetical protein
MTFTVTKPLIRQQLTGGLAGRGVLPRIYAERIELLVYLPKNLGLMSELKKIG